MFPLQDYQIFLSLTNMDALTKSQSVMYLFENRGRGDAMENVGTRTLSSVSRWTGGSRSQSEASSAVSPSLGSTEDKGKDEAGGTPGR